MERILKLIKNTDGQALVESALVMSFVLIPLILLMIDLGWALNGKITLTSAAREGARAAAVCNTESKDGKTAEDVAKEVAEKTIAKYTDDSNSLINPSVTSFTFDTENKKVELEVSAEIEPLTKFFSKDNISLKEKAQMRIE